MFSMAQKMQIAQAVEKVLLSFDHPEMPKEKPIFQLRVEGEEAWSWANIEPNWLFDDEHKKAGINPHNEMVAAKQKDGGR